jgi:hypothetical protein
MKKHELLLARRRADFEAVPSTSPIRGPVQRPEGGQLRFEPLSPPFVHRNLSYQQDLSAVDIAVVVLLARSNALDVLRPRVPLVLDALANRKRRAVTLIRAEGESQANTQQ